MVNEIVRREYALVLLVICIVPTAFAIFMYRLGLSPRFIGWTKDQEPVPTFLGALTLPFALFFAFMVNDIWGRETQLARTVQQEAQRLLTGLDLAMMCGAPCQPVKLAIHDYARTLADLEWNPGWVELKPEAGAALENILTAVAAAERDPQVTNAVRSGFVTTLTTLRSLRSERNALLHVELGPRRGMMVLLLGFITQFGIAAIHVGRRAGLIITLGSFTIAFVATLAYATTVGWPTVDESILTADDLMRLLGSG